MILQDQTDLDDKNNAICLSGHQNRSRQNDFFFCYLSSNIPLDANRDRRRWLAFQQIFRFEWLFQTIRLQKETKRVAENLTQ